jgi:hypothetical protein
MRCQSKPALMLWLFWPSVAKYVRAPWACRRGRDTAPSKVAPLYHLLSASLKIGAPPNSGLTSNGSTVIVSLASANMSSPVSRSPNTPEYCAATWLAVWLCDVSANRSAVVPRPSTCTTNPLDGESLYFTQTLCRGVICPFTRMV